MFLLASVRHVGPHPGGNQHGVSIQISTYLGKTILQISRIRKILRFWPESWRGSLYIYLLSFARFWTLSINPREYTPAIRYARLKFELANQRLATRLN